MKKRDRRTKQDVKGSKADKRAVKEPSRSLKQDIRGSKRQASSAAAGAASVRGRSKRSGVEAVKLHIEVTGSTGRTSRSATSVRKTSVRMTSIKEYPFDLSDIKNEPSENTGDTPAQPPPANQVPSKAASSVSVPEKRKVSIMADADSKDRENLPSDRNGRISGQAEGPSRRKSNLHNAMASEMDSSWGGLASAVQDVDTRKNAAGYCPEDLPWRQVVTATTGKTGDRQAHIEGRFKKYSTTSSVYSKKALSQQSEHIERSWWYACCAKCHQEESGIPSWEPPNWQKVCPYPLCPSYRHFAQTLAVLLIGVLVWVIIWIVMGETAAPGGQLFMLATLTIASYFGGWLMMKITTLPGLIGMLIVGIILKNVGFVNFDSDYQKVSSYIRKIALTIILTRAGLDLDPVALKKYFLTVIKLALVPWTFECVLCAVLSYYFLGLPWDWAFLLGSVVAAVSPAVIVPCLFRLRGKGYGVSKGIPTLVLAVSGVDDAASVAVFGIVSSVMFSGSSLTYNIIQGPLSVIGGIAFGVFCGYLVKFVPERNDAFLVPLRVMLLLAGGLCSVLGSEEIGWGGAGPLAVIAFGFIACKNWVEQGWEMDDNPVATAFEIFWMLFEPMLFGVTGAQVVIADLEPHMVMVGTGILMTCVVLRAMLTSACAVRSNLNMKEKIFVGLAWMAKATVQAALAPVALDEIRKLAGADEPDPKLIEYAESIITICILSIVITAPLGAIIITITGPRLLSRTTKPPVLEGWRRSHRPSIRDISIIDEEEVTERDAEAESPPPESPVSPAAFSTPTPITVQPNNRQ